MIHEKTEDLKRRLMNFMQRNTPIKADTRSLHIENLTITEPSAVNDLDQQLNMKYSESGNLKGWLRGNVTVTDNKTNKEIAKTNPINLIPVYYMTDRGTYISNGIEKNILTQMRLKPGVYTEKGADIRTNLMFDMTKQYLPRIDIIFDPGAMSFKIIIKRGKDTKFDGIGFLRELGFSDAEIKRAIGNDSVSDMLFSVSRERKSIYDIFKAITGKTSSDTPDKTRDMLFSYFDNEMTFGEDGKESVKSTINSSSKSLNKDIILRSVNKNFAVFRNEVEEDDKDDLRFKVVSDDNDLIMEEVAQDFEVFKSSVINTLNTREVLNSSDLRGLTKLGKNIDKFMKESDLSQNPEQTNPLEIASIDRKVTQIGGFQGISKDNADKVIKPRNLKAMAINRLDPVETPESTKIGLIEHLTQSAEVKNKTISTEFIKVKDGVAVNTLANVVKLTPDKEYDSKVAFYDLRYIRKDGNKIIFTKDVIPGRYKSKIQDIHISEIQYVDRAPQNLLNYAANMIPFVSHDDGNRTLMGTNMQRQAVSIINREVPLVMSASDDKRTYEDVIGEKYGKPVNSTTSGVVKDITSSRIIIKDEKGKEHAHNYYDHFPVNQSFINNELLIKKGQEVKKGQMLAEGWQTRDGKLALGANARVAYMPFKGFNYEDGVVVSKDFANKMSSEEMHQVEIEIYSDYLGGKGSNIRDELKKYTVNQEILTRLDKDGIIKEGSYVKPGNILVAFLAPEDKYETYGLSEVLGIKKKNVTYKLGQKIIEESSYLEGTVKRINIIESPEAGIKQKIVVSLLSEKSLKLGDKISGKHGNKGIITKILPTSEMPVAEDGKNVDLIFSPLAVPSRKNLGQLLEVNAGLIAEKKGKPFIVNNFDPKEKERVEKELKEIGIPDGKMKVSLRERQDDDSIKEIPVDNRVTVGNMYIMKLKHKIDDKVQSRSNIEGVAPERKTFMPAKKLGQAQGEKYNPQRLGEMEMRVLQAHGAVHNILESSTIKADGGGNEQNRIAIYNAIATGKLDSLDFSATPETINVMADTLKGLGLNVKPINNGDVAKSFDEAYDSLAVVPMKPSQMIKMIGKDNEVTQPKMYDAKAGGRQVPYRRGLADPEIFGDDKSSDLEDRKKWGYIKLGTPIPNPILMSNASYNPYSLITGMKDSQLKELMDGKKVMVIDPEKYEAFKGNKEKIEEVKANMDKLGFKPGDLVDPQKLEKLDLDSNVILWKAGGEGIQHLLDNVDLESELKKSEQKLKDAKPKDIDKHYKKYKSLLTLKNNNLNPGDLMLHYLPVTPHYFRPTQMQGKKVVLSDLSELYGNVIKSNNSIINNYESGFDMIGDSDPEQAARLTRSLYKTVSYATGDKEYYHPRKKRKMLGIIESLGKKEGLIRNKMLGKRVDFSGRSVIGVDPNLKLDEVGIPLDMAKNIYKPFIVKELMSRGLAKDRKEATKKIKKGDSDVKKILDDLAKDRPVLLNRAPSLHKFNIQAYTPVIKDYQDGEAVKIIQLNPLSVSGYNADFDGDTMSVHLPVTEKANEEAKKLMRPSDNLINPTNGKMIVEIRHEMALGIYYLTMSSDKVKGEGKTYSNIEQLRKDFKDGNINVKDKVTIGGKTSTAGQAMYNLLLPEKYRNYSLAWSAKDISKMFLEMYQEAERTNGKAISISEVSRILDNVKDLGFEASTRSGISIGIGDFKKIEDADQLFDSHVKKEMKTNKNPNDAKIQGWLKAEGEIQDRLKKGEILAYDNPVQIMMASGARSKPDQVRRMMVSVGVGMDLTDKLTSPVKHSHLDGLSPQEYWTHSYDSRKGMYDRTVETREPGAFSREVWSVTQDIVIKEKDCKTRDGISIPKSNPSALGRFLSEDVLGTSSIIATRDSLITKEVYDKIYKDETVKMIKIRSPLKCKVVNGLCQKCYGTMPGTMQTASIGSPTGVIASQALSEPATQMTMNTFHSGGTGSAATVGFPRIKQILNLSKDSESKAVLARTSGNVISIKKGAKGTFDIVRISNVDHNVPHTKEGASQKIKVSIGDNVIKGDFLTYGDIDDINAGEKLILSADPREMFALKSEELGQDKAWDYTQNYLTNSIQRAYEDTFGIGAVDNRHLETVVSKMTSRVTIMDPGDSNFIRGDVVEKNQADQWNSINAGEFSVKTKNVSNAGEILNSVAHETYKDRAGNTIVSKGDMFTEENIPKLMLANISQVKVKPKPVKYNIELLSKNQAVTKGHDNWLSNMGHENVKEQLTRAVVKGQVDKLNDPRTRLMTGKLLNIGEGFNAVKQKANSIANRMFNFFSKDD